MWRQSRSKLNLRAALPIFHVIDPHYHVPRWVIGPAPGNENGWAFCESDAMTPWEVATCWMPSLVRAVMPGEGTPPPLPLSPRPTVSTMPRYDPRTPSRRPLDYVEFGPGLVDDTDRRVIGDTRRRKVLDLGCGAGHTAVGLARRGARVIATDSDAEQVAAARALAAEHDVAIEFHEAGPAELAFVRADQIDLAVSVWALSLVEDLDRVFRQVHRCVRAGGHVVVSLPHPALLTADPHDPTRVA